MRETKIEKQNKNQKIKMRTKRKAISQR